MRSSPRTGNASLREVIAAAAGDEKLVQTAAFFGNASDSASDIDFFVLLRADPSRYTNHQNLRRWLEHFQAATLRDADLARSVFFPSLRLQTFFTHLSSKGARPPFCVHTLVYPSQSFMVDWESMNPGLVDILRDKEPFFGSWPAARGRGGHRLFSNPIRILYETACIKYLCKLSEDLLHEEVTHKVAYCLRFAICEWLHDQKRIPWTQLDSWRQLAVHAAKAPEVVKDAAALAHRLRFMPQSAAAAAGESPIWEAFGHIERLVKCGKSG